MYYAAPGAVPQGHPVTITPGPGSGCFGDSYLNYSCYGSPIFHNRSGMLSGGTTYGTPVYSYTSSCYGSGFGSGPVFYGPDFHPTYAPCCEPGLGKVVTPPQVRIDRSEYDVTKAKPVSGVARLTIELPAEAKLYVDGVQVKGEGLIRNFHTPELPIGQTFYYEIMAEVTVDGKTVKDTKIVLVKAGEVFVEGFPKLVAALAASKGRDVLAKQ